MAGILGSIVRPSVDPSVIDPATGIPVGLSFDQENNQYTDTAGNVWRANQDPNFGEPATWQNITESSKSGMDATAVWAQRLGIQDPVGFAARVIRDGKPTARDIAVLQGISSVAPQYDASGKLTNGGDIWNDTVTRAEDREASGERGSFLGMEMDPGIADILTLGSAYLGGGYALADAPAAAAPAAAAGNAEAASTGGLLKTGADAGEILSGGPMPAGVTAGGGVDAINGAAAGSISKGLSDAEIATILGGGGAGAGAASLVNAGSTTAAGSGGGTVGDETFLDNWDMQPDPYNTYQDPSVMDMGGDGGFDLSSLSGPLKQLLTSSAGRALLGVGAGGLLGALGANSKPSGTTTTVQDVPEWLKPYVMGNLNSATGARDALLGGGNATSAAMPEYLKTMSGAYLDPASNPYLDATYKHAAGLVGAGVDSRFEAAGRYGSGAHQGVLQEGLGNLATSIYGGNYQAERARQAAAVTGAPGFDTSRATAAFAPYTAYKGLFPGSTATTQPYFSNTAGGILGGALAGGSLSRLFG